MSMGSHSWWRRKTTIAALAGAGLFSLGCSVTSDLVAYEDLPPEEARYTLELDSGDAVTVWEYTSEHVDESTSVQPCMGAAQGDPTFGECRPEPLIFLRYDLGLNLDETVAANRPHTFTVTAYYEPQLTTPPQVTDLSVEVSYDGGQTWQQATASQLRYGTYRVTVKHPRDAEEVSLRVSASDSDGNTVVQTLPEVFSVR
jgi:hypothetical protein